MLAKYGRYSIEIPRIVLFGVIIGVVDIASITALGNIDTCKNQWRFQDSDGALTTKV